MKVCPHCAEELPDDATACSNCHKDPAMAPAWLAPRRPDEPPPWWSEDAFAPNNVPRTSDGVPRSYERLEPAVAGEGSTGVPTKIWVSFILALGWGVIPLPASMAGLILRPAGYVVGLVLAVKGRGEVAASDRLAHGLAMVAVILNAIDLALAMFGVLNHVIYVVPAGG